MNLTRIVLVGLLLLAFRAWGADGLIVVTSSHGPKETMDRLESIVKQKGSPVSG